MEVYCDISFHYEADTFTICTLCCLAVGRLVRWKWGCNIKLGTRGRIDAQFSVLPDVFRPVISQHCMWEQLSMNVVLLFSMQRAVSHKTL